MYANFLKYFFRKSIYWEWKDNFKNCQLIVNLQVCMIRKQCFGFWIHSWQDKQL